MSGIQSQTISILNIKDGWEHWTAVRIWDSGGASIPFASIDKVATERFGAGQYQLVDLGTAWRLTAPSTLTQVRTPF